MFGARGSSTTKAGWRPATMQPVVLQNFPCFLSDHRYRGEKFNGPGFHISSLLSHTSSTLAQETREAPKAINQNRLKLPVGRQMGNQEGKWLVSVGQAVSGRRGIWNHNSGIWLPKPQYDCSSLDTENKSRSYVGGGGLQGPGAMQKSRPLPW